ncbi:glycosyltransferase family 4 protein [Rhodalgimonas zhirmunskyi]|uniref:Glycosyltransferase family 4 protein n=1 Tax=Rhodalgimonas zhirmunskyi TaxID=2964767 RepID=A0AAJ1U617_9RHOB|nr:glycosyltransferase family 1 protein [Rhodoalgimonas zhirmunskyi]MDQ2094270.1 glycosyltransferase family 4 protein [Rhodoalgimonas zhirmunskyi]
MTANARLLDLSRIISRAGKTLTGVDRVELAYLKALIAQDTPCFGLVKTSVGFILLDREGMRGIARRAEEEEPWGKADRLSRVFRKLDDSARRGQSDARRLAMARTHRRGLGKMLARHLPEGSSYLNVGHSNLSDRVLHSVKHGAKARIAVMIHDAIPLDHPLYQTPVSVERFRDILGRVRAMADLVIYNSQATRRAVEGHMRHMGDKIPQGVVAHLGVDLPASTPGDLPKGLPPEGPYFVSVGTIEPRKNHALLIDIWERLVKQTPPQEMPHLVICGTRGWMNEEVFFRLDRSALMGEFVHEYADLSDGAVAALLEGASGALYPSFAEGYGLPMIEAAARGVPVVCAELPVFGELLKDYPIYASLKDSYLWQRRITSLAGIGRAKRADGPKRETPLTPPTWDDHFNVILKLT